MNPTTKVVYVNPALHGYHPVFYMARLAAEFLEAELVELRPRALSFREKLVGLIPRKKGESACLMICPQPADLATVLLLEKWRQDYSRLVAWVFDSFWPEYIPRFVSLAGIFDHVFVTEQEDLETWRKSLRAPVDWLPWGSDALRLGLLNSVRPIDLLRFGRQPQDWDDDASSMTICNSMNLRFQGRPPYFSDASESERELMKILGQTKFTLSFSNIVSPTVQTHPTREYITGRWTDALSAGATVAGIPPRSKGIQSLLWEGALLDVGTVDRAEGLEIIADAVRRWKPQCAHHNYMRSLEVLDWRWRFQGLASALEIQPAKLESELECLRRTIDHHRQG
jgi:hypothetical protein